MKLFQITLVCAIGFAYCNGQNPKVLPSNSELILESILDPRNGLFRPSIFDTARQSCPVEPSSTSDNTDNDALQDPEFLDHCATRIRLKSFLNETLIEQICNAAPTWKKCGNVIAPHIDKCYAKDLIKATYSWKFAEGFSSYFCKDSHNFIENLIEKSSGALVCLSPNIKRELVDCLGAQETINPRKKQTSADNIDTELCRSYDIVQYCVNQVYKNQCANSFPKITQMLAEIKTAIECQDFKSPLIADGSSIQPGKAKDKKPKGKNAGSTLKKEISAIIPIFAISLMISSL